MPFTLPAALRDPDDQSAIAFLGSYFNSGRYTGALFDAWDSTGTREADADRFTADDLVAVTFLSVAASGEAAELLLRSKADVFTTLLSGLDPEVDLVNEPSVLKDDWLGWQVMRELRTLPDVGPTTASKLLARKRPRLRPIWDTVVADVTGTHDTLWGPLHLALAADDGALHVRLDGLREKAALPASVTVLRVFDVICWMEGKAQGLGKRRGQ